MIVWVPALIHPKKIHESHKHHFGCATLEHKNDKPPTGNTVTADRFGYSDLCIPSQNGGFFVRLHPQSHFFSDSARVNLTGENSDPLCEPSQNGCFFDKPQAHHQ